MKNRIYAIILIILLSLLFSNSLVCFARNSRRYISEEHPFLGDDDTEEADEEETDDTEESDENESGSATEPSSESQGSEIGPIVDEDEEGGIVENLPFETIGGDSFWIGWRKHHYGYSPQPTTYKSQEVTYKYRIIRNGVRSYETSTAVANGYGIYNMDYSKHMVGFLNYAFENYNQNYTVPFVDKTGVELTGDSEPTEDPIPVNDAIEKAMNKVITTWYAKDYEEGTSYLQSFKADGFRKFWTVSFTNDYEADIRIIQNEFFKNVYASEALTKLDSFINKFDMEYRPAIRGVIFSIMESRFRNKNLQGKKNLRLKVKEKELWPFYVYCEKNILGRIMWPKDDGDYKGIDKVIDGAYQWMYYYDTKFKSSSHSTLTSFMLANETQEEASEVDWEMEYEELTNKPFPYLYGDELQAFYDRITKVRSMFTESADNAEGMFGAEEIYNNTSSFSFSNAMVNMQNAMFDFCKDEHGNVDETIWSGLNEKNAARSYMLAKNIVENERVQSEYAYYNIGTNIVTYSAGRQDSSILLKDLQRVKLLQSLSDEGDRDTDGDGITDGNELITSAYSVDITKFVEKMVMAELYGKEQSGVTETKKQEIMKNFMNNVRDIATERRDDNGAECHFGVENGKLTVELYDYSSNPVIKDTDFDGLTDLEESDMYGVRCKELLDNKISGDMQTQDNQTVINAETHMDYRYFFMNNKNYYDELSTMSLMLCNAMENPYNTAINDVEQLLNRIGMNDNRTTREAVAGGSRVNYITATNDIEYTHNADETPIKKRVKLIAIKSIIDNDSNKNIEHIGTSGDSGYYSNNHKVFDELAKYIYYNEINGSRQQSLSTPSNVYWITGYNTGGAVANILSARIIDNKSSIASNRDNTGVYCYTFGAPYTVYNYEGQAINTVESKYCSIMNLINESDIYSYIMPQKLGWSRYGMTCVKSEKEVGFLGRWWRDRTDRNKAIKNDRISVEEDIETIFNGRINTFRSSYYDNYDKKKTDEYIMHEIFKGMRNNTLDSVIQHIDRNEWTNDTTRGNNYSKLAKHLKENNRAFKNARNLSVYYNISKSITPNDVTFRVSSDTTFRGYEASQDYKTAVRKMMEWYVSHVATYQHNHDNVYQGHTLLGSEEAEEYYNRYNLQNYVGAGNDEDDFLYARNVEWLNVPESNIVLYRDFWGRGLYYCQSYADRMNQTHTMVGDDCTGLVMAVIGYYAGDDLKDNEYALDSSDNFQINNVGTPTFRWHYRRLSNWLATQGHMYLYEVNSDTTVNDLEFGDILITCDASVTGHAEFYIDNEHTWGWGFKHCSLYDEGNLGWKGRVEKNTKVISRRNVPCFYIKDKYNYYKDTNDNMGSITVQDDRPYQYVLSPNPNKRNMTAIFNTEG